MSDKSVYCLIDDEPVFDWTEVITKAQKLYHYHSPDGFYTVGEAVKILRDNGHAVEPPHAAERT